MQKTMKEVNNISRIGGFIKNIYQTDD